AGLIVLAGIVAANADLHESGGGKIEGGQQGLHFLEKPTVRAETRVPSGLRATDGEVHSRNPQQGGGRVDEVCAAAKAPRGIERKLSNSVCKLEEIAGVRVTVAERLDPRECDLRPRLAAHANERHQRAKQPRPA